jgi:hemerythrin
MTRQEWYDRAMQHGTSGDMVFDILADWKKEQDTLQQRIDKLTKALKSIVNYGEDCRDNGSHYSKDDIDSIARKALEDVEAK